MPRPKPIVAIVGRPNVGKSCLFNRTIGRRLAVVDDMSGVTRDRNYADATWNGIAFAIIDTGGVLPPSDDQMTEEVRSQVELAVAESDVIVFLVDIHTGPTDLDLFIARLLHRAAPGRVVMAANKAESTSTHADLGVFMQLGLGEPVAVSALHGTGVGDLLDRVTNLLKHKDGPPLDIDDHSLKIAILGRPNAGKSSIVNRLLGAKRMIVHDQPGTTRDAIDSPLVYHGKDVTLIDTAGLRKRTHVTQRVEHYANLRAIDSIPRADVCVLVIDAALGIGEQDIRILHHIEDAHKGVVLCLNKWDLVAKDHKTFDHLVKELRATYMELRCIPVLSVSALSGQRVPVVLQTAFEVGERMRTRVPAAEFRDLLKTWTTKNPPPMVSGKQVKIMGGKQAPADYPLFLIFAGNHKLVKAGYVRYLVNHIHEAFDFGGCPVTIVLRPPAVATGRPRPRAAAGRAGGTR